MASVFSKLRQHNGEAISDYAADHRKVSLHCGFGGSLTIAIRDQFVFGLRNELVQQRLLKDNNLMFDVAVESAKLDETASRDALEPQVKLAATADVNRLQCKRLPNKRNNSMMCYRCGKGPHPPDECRYKDYVCHKCQKVGHISPVCPSTHTRSKAATKRPNTQRVNTKQIHNIQKHEKDDDDDFVIGTLHALDKSTESIWVESARNGSVRSRLRTLLS